MTINVSTIVEYQFPELYQEDGENLIAFMKAYYEWKEQANLIKAQDLLDLDDVDTTVDEFITHFKQKYLAGVPDAADVDLRLFIKHCNDLYSSKGTEAAVKLLFRLLYNVSAELYYPLDNTFTASAGEWIVPQYIEVTASDKSPSLVHQRIYGHVSGARAIVNSMCRKVTNGFYYDVLYLEHLEGHFEQHEAVILADRILTNAPIVLGSLNQVIVSEGGKNNKVGDVFSVFSPNGKGGKVRVSDTIDGTRKVSTTLADPGAVYTANAATYTSNTMLNLTSSGNGYSFYLYEVVEQPLFQVSYTTANNTFAVGDVVQSYTGSKLQANGVVVAVTGNTASGNVTIFAANGNFRLGSTLMKTGNVISATIASASDVSATGIVMGSNTTAVGVSKQTNVFYAGGSTWIRGRFSAGVSNVASLGQGSGAAFSISAISQDEALYLNTDVFGGNNTAGVPYIYINGDGSGSGVGYVNTISVSAGGTGYANGASLTFKGGGQFLSGFVVAAPGTGYANGDALMFSSGINAIATLSTNASGSIVGVSMIDPGKFFGAVPAVSINTVAGTGGSITALMTNATANAVGTISTNSTGGIVSATISSGGGVYFNAPIVTAPTGTGANLVPVMSYGYGFPKKPTADQNSYLQDMFTMALTPVGTIQGLSGLAYGSNYDHNPMTEAVEPLIEGFDQDDIVIQQSGTTGAFAVGETITAPYSVQVMRLTYTGISGNTSFDVGEFVSQGANTAYGVIYDRDASTVKLVNVTGTFAVTSNTSTTIVGGTSHATANVSVVASANVVTTAKGLVVANDGQNLTIRPRTFGAKFTTGATLTGLQTQSTATASTIAVISNSAASGNNAVISSLVQSANGIATGLKVIDSGYGYRDLEQVTMVNDQNGNQLTGQIIVSQEGTGSGYHKSKVSYPSSGNYLQDSFYYQRFSYEVQSEIPFDKYSQILKDLLHVSGTKMFGKTVLNPQVDLSAQVVSSSIS